MQAACRNALGNSPRALATTNVSPMAEQRKKLRLGELLVQQGLITPDQLRIALTEQKHQQAPLGRLLVRLGFVTEAVIRDIMVGEEQRLSWLDALRGANAQSQLYGVDYEVGAQQPYSFSSEAGANGLAVQQSVMKLRLGLLNESDLFTFFRALAAQKVGAFSVNQCNLQRLVPETTKPANQATLKAECEVAWITLPGPTAAEGGS